MNNELKKAAHIAAWNNFPFSGDRAIGFPSYLEGFEAGANWQREQDKEVLAILQELLDYSFGDKDDGGRSKELLETIAQANKLISKHQQQ